MSIILDNGRFVIVDPTRVLANKLRPIPVPDPQNPEQLSVSPPIFRNLLRAAARRSWRVMLRGLSILLPFSVARRFLFATPDQFGLAWCVQFPLRAVGLRLEAKSVAEIPETTLDQYASCDGSILLLLDSSWPFPLWPAVERFKRRGGKVVGVIYDLIPITHPETSVPAMVAEFDNWLRQHLYHTHALIGISCSTARELRQFILRLEWDGQGVPSPPVIGHFHLGSDLDLIDSEEEIRPAFKEIFAAQHHIFLMVSSFEPRKNHGYVLDAFDSLWQSGHAATLLMIGRRAWKTEEFLARAATHSQKGRQLFVERDASDSELDYAYRNSSALIMASEVEGFGLPIVEAFQRGLPVLCSDIPVFREIADQRAVFFDISRSCSLAEASLSFIHEHDALRRTERIPNNWLSWRESTEQLFSEITCVMRGGGALHPSVTIAGKASGRR